MINLLKKIVANFIFLNSDLPIGGILLADTITSYGTTITRFIADTVLPLNVEPPIIVHSLTPILLRIQLNICNLDDSTCEGTPIGEQQGKKGRDLSSFFKHYPAEVPGLNFRLQDSLNFFKDSLQIMRYEGSYKILYKTEFYKKDLLEYDRIYAEGLFAGQTTSDNAHQKETDKFTIGEEEKSERVGPAASWKAMKEKPTLRKATPCSICADKKWTWSSN